MNDKGRRDEQVSKSQIAFRRICQLMFSHYFREDGTVRTKNGEKIALAAWSRGIVSTCHLLELWVVRSNPARV
jgi:hypothetical protein